MSGVEIQPGHSNIADLVLKRLGTYCSNKPEDITEEEKQKYKVYFKGKEGCFYY